MSSQVSIQLIISISVFSLACSRRFRRMSCAEERCATKAIKLIIYPVGIPPPQIKEMTDMFVIRSCSSSPSSFSSPAIDMLVASNYDKKYHLYASNYALN